MNITPLDIQHHQFTTKFRGFDPDEVLAFLEEITAAFAEVLSENEKLRKKTEMIKREIQGYRKREEMFKHAVLNSQKLQEESKRNAEKSSDLILAEAELKADKILSGAQNRLAGLNEEIAELKRQRIQIEAQIRTVIETHSKLLNIGNEASRASDEEYDKIKLFNRS